MTKEEVAQVIAYCEEKKISYKQRLEELGINPWNFYDAKRRYAPKQEGDNAGEFLQLVPGGVFFPNPIKPARSKSGKQKNVVGKEPSEWMKDVLVRIPGNENNRAVLRDLLPDRWTKQSN